MKANLSFYKYETKCITIVWNGITQPYGSFFTADEAVDFLLYLLSSTTENLDKYSLQTKNGLISLK
jgi:hypothetical protein